MINNRPILILILLFGSTILFGQVKAHLKDLKSDRTTPLTIEDMRLQNFAPAIPNASPAFQQPRKQYQTLPSLIKPVDNHPNLKIHTAPDTGLPFVIEGTMDLPEGDYQTRGTAYLETVKEALQIQHPAEEFIVKKISAEPSTNQVHYRMDQVYEGIPVYGSEVLLHEQNDAVYLFNGRYYPTPIIENLTPTISKNAAEQTTRQDLELTTTFKELSDLEKVLLDGEQVQSELVIYHKNRDDKQEHLAWHFTVLPNVAARWSYFVDAHTGEILHQFSHICKFAGEHHHHHACEHEQEKEEVLIINNLPPDGPATANATDLFGISRLINTYEVGSTFFMIDGSRTMFNGTQSNLPDEPVGSIWTIDAQGTSPANNDFAAIHVSSNNNSWNNNPKAVSAHYNGGEAYEYFASTFGRNSINGQGGNIISLVDVADENGGDMDNAFWSGAAMFYGNGNQAFSSPLSKALDVAGHEMSHGVVQTTANLEYQGESGALNESFADIFGAMIDRDDWKMGEDIVNTSIFSSGALRDLQNPNNGGNSLNDAGYQPDHVNDQFTGSQDNGGVHINSGITNRAYYLFATEVGKEKAEQVYYRALTNYLVKSSQFVDLRIAVVQAATDLHGANSTEVDAAKNALSAVGIGEGAGTQTQTDVGQNDGDEYVLMSDDGLSQLYIFTPAGDEIAVTPPLSTSSPISKPSITDNGSVIVFVDSGKNIQRITIDWNTGNVNQEALSTNPIWRNVAISKDGTKIAALTDDLDNRLLVFDLVNGDGYPEEFELYTPTTGDGGPTTNEVQYADVIEFDFTGEWILYDAFNEINNANGEDIDYWDIGFIRVYENTTNSFDDGFISKLFSGLPENTSVGNPTFSKNSDYVIALDFIDEFSDEYAILGVNTETGETGTILSHTQLGYPNYSVSDEQIVFDDNPGFFDDPQLSFVDLQDNKISGTGNVDGFITNGKWGVWFADGERTLTNTADLNLAGDALKIYPNPFNDNLKIDIETTANDKILIEIFDVVGKRVFTKNMQVYAGSNIEELDASILHSGTYFVKMTREGASKTVRVSKF